MGWGVSCIDTRRTRKVRRACGQGTDMDTVYPSMDGFFLYQNQSRPQSANPSSDQAKQKSSLSTCTRERAGRQMRSSRTERGLSGQERVSYRLRNASTESCSSVVLQESKQKGETQVRNVSAACVTISRREGK